MSNSPSPVLTQTAVHPAIQGLGTCERYVSSRSYIPDTSLMTFQARMYCHVRTHVNAKRTLVNFESPKFGAALC